MITKRNYSEIESLVLSSSKSLFSVTCAILQLVVEDSSDSLAKVVISSEVLMF